MPVRILLVDDHVMVRSGLRTLLQPEADMAIVGEAGGVKEAIQKAVELQPDVVLMDIRLPDGSGTEAIRAIKQSCPNTQVLVLTILDDKDALLKAIQAGATGYLLKDVPPEDLAQAIRSVHTNGTVLHPAVARKMVEHLAATERDAAPVQSHQGVNLTERETEVLRGVTRGLSDKEIALKLYLSEPTIKRHVRSIYQKLRVRNRAQAAAYATKSDLPI